MMAIQTCELSKSYGYYRIFENLSFTVAPGECFALFGPNGAGKTTLLQILATLNRPTGGRFEILGYDGVTQRSIIRNHIVFLAHGSHLYDDLNPVENLKFALALRGITPSPLALKRSLDFVGIGAFSELKVRFFSAGMKKRLALAKVALIHPQVLFLDEPYTALDDAGVSVTNHLIREVVTTGGAVFMTTHDRGKAVEVTNRAGVLTEGELQLLDLGAQGLHDLP